MGWLLLATWIGCTCRPQPDPRPIPPPGPDIVWFTVDTLRADRLGYAGHAGADTPTIDALARRGAVFADATTPLPRTTPALASALTGRTPARHGSVEVGDPIDAVPTVAEALHDAGWHTVGVSAMSVAGPEQGLDRGFETFEVLHDAPAPEVVDRALALLPDDGRRRFLWVHTADPHFPYLPPEADDADPCARVGRAAASGELMRVDLFVDRDGRARQLLPACEALYDREIAVVDAALAQLLDRLGGDPLVVFSADHGEHLGEQGLYYEHGPTVHAANASVPLIVAGPSIPAGPRQGLAQLTDLAPTTLALAGLDPAPLDADGHDLSETLTRGQAIDRPLAGVVSGSALQLRLSTSTIAGRGKRWCLHDERFSLCHRPRGVTLHDRARDPELRRDVSSRHPDVRARLAAASETWGPETGRERAVIGARYKLVGRPEVEGGWRWSLFDRAADPHEQEDVAAEHPDVVKELLAQGPALWGDLAGAEPLDDGQTEQLRALGYVE